MIFIHRVCVRTIRRVKFFLWRTLVPKLLISQGVEMGSGVFFYGRPIVSLAKNSSITLGANCVLCSDSEYTALGVKHPVVLRTLREGAEITIGENSGLSGTTICAAVSVFIGRDVLVGADVTIADTDFHPIKPQNRRHNTDPNDVMSSPVIISDNVFIGGGTYVLKGVTIGKNSIIGANSVVTSNVPPDTIFAGNPARKVKNLPVFD